MPLVGHILPIPHVLATTDVFCAPKLWPIQVCLINGILQYLAFGVWLLSMHMSLTSVVECISSLSIIFIDK